MLLREILMVSIMVTEDNLPWYETFIGGMSEIISNYLLHIWTFFGDGIVFLTKEIATTPHDVDRHGFLYQVFLARRILQNAERRKHAERII